MPWQFHWIMFMALFMMDRFYEAGLGGCLCCLTCRVFLHALEGSRKDEGEHTSKLLLVPSVILQVDLLGKVFNYFGEKDCGDVRLHFLWLPNRLVWLLGHLGCDFSLLALSLISLRWLLWFGFGLLTLWWAGCRHRNLGSNGGRGWLAFDLVFGCREGFRIAYMLASP